jgi:hypothetical protein
MTAAPAVVLGDNFLIFLSREIIRRERFPVKVVAGVGMAGAPGEGEIAGAGG